MVGKGVMNVTVREMVEQDIPYVAGIYLENFKGMRDHADVVRWVESKHRSKPVCMYYVATLMDQPIGYILWTEHGGFRSKAVIELEQVAVARMYQGMGVGSMLVVESLRHVCRYLHGRGSELKLVLVTTSTANVNARRLYEKTINAREHALLHDIYGGDELVMVARREDIPFLDGWDHL